MSHTPHETAVFAPAPVESPAPVVEAPAHQAPAPPAPTAEQMKAADAVFARQEKESATVAGLLGLWTGGMLLRDVAVDSLTPEEEGDEADPTKKPRPDGGHPPCC
jgi:hypothetical protein